MRGFQSDAPPSEDASPFIGCFQTDKYTYFYDVNKNAIVRIPESTFVRLKVLLHTGGALADNEALLRDPVIQALLDQGYFSSHRARKVALGLSEEKLTSLLESHVEQCTLELTQHCNLDCGYCSHSPGHPGRRDHSKKRMSWATAKAAIDYFLSHSEKSGTRSLGFYGGEPLLEWPLLRRCVEYALNVAEPGSVQISFTTNATLITDEIARFCAGKGIRISVSLDGPAETHDAMRRKRGSGQGSHAETLAAITRLQEAYKDRFEERISIIAVYGPWSDLESVVHYFSHHAPEAVLKLDVAPTAAGLSEGGSVAALSASTIGKESLDRLRRQWLDALIGRKEMDPEELRMVQPMFDALFLRFYHRNQEPLEESLPLKGMCIPGVRRMYVDVDGRILPCERVSERDEYMLGHIDAGHVDPLESLKVCRYIEDWFSERCPNCIYCRLCSGCLSQFTDDDGLMSDDYLHDICKGQYMECENLLLTWTRALEDCPTCFDYMENMSLR